MFVVASWEGGQSVVDSHHTGDSDQEKKRRWSDDDWNEEIDRGKVGIPLLTFLAERLGKSF